MAEDEKDKKKMDASESFCSSSSTHRRRYLSKSCRPLNTALVVACGIIKIKYIVYWRGIKFGGLAVELQTANLKAANNSGYIMVHRVKWWW